MHQCSVMIYSRNLWQQRRSVCWSASTDLQHCLWVNNSLAACSCTFQAASQSPAVMYMYHCQQPFSESAACWGRDLCILISVICLQWLSSGMSAKKCLGTWTVLLLKTRKLCMSTSSGVDTFALGEQISSKHTEGLSRPQVVTVTVT